MLIITPELNMILLVSFFFIRLVGAILFLDFFLQYRKKHYLYLVFAFIFIAFSPGIDYISLLVEDPFLADLIFIISELSLSASLLLLILVFFSYNPRFSSKFILFLPGIMIISILGLVLFNYFGRSTAFEILQIIDLLMLLALVPYTYFYFKDFQELASKIPVFFISILLVSIINVLVTLLPDFEISILVELITRFGYSVMLPILFLHFEYSLLGKEKFDLKDRYSHDLSQLVQNILARTYLMDLENNTESVRNHQLEIDQNCIKISNLIKQIREV